MDQESQNPPPGLRHLNLKKSFKLGIRSLLTACSKEDFSKAFSMFNNAEQEGLHRLFLQVITSMHENIEEQFESICRETEVGTILDIVEQFVEEQTLDTLSTDKLWNIIASSKLVLNPLRKDKTCQLLKILLGS
ncbi:PREDICTED: uncharacterized protein LOC104587279 isoform X3 [Nelumbo nucifera]|uniref:Uncharacterized protein LOC104587279 isoform X3 n=1 Tax=Nelumbo nucifera TaxID=4432 RepID=A0A1U7Z7Z6_NELNU|nr:PREDICTED: uncharacterized protein LOC104587279 isoform X3 [Nelumbo nucifera]